MFDDVSSRPNNFQETQDAIVVVMQRLHVDDLVGHLVEQGGWNPLSPRLQHDDANQKSLERNIDAQARLSVGSER